MPSQKLTFFSSVVLFNLLHDSLFIITNAADNSSVPLLGTGILLRYCIGQKSRTVSKWTTMLFYLNTDFTYVLSISFRFIQDKNKYMHVPDHSSIKMQVIWKKDWFILILYLLCRLSFYNITTIKIKPIKQTQSIESIKILIGILCENHSQNTRKNHYCLQFH